MGGLINRGGELISGWAYIQNNIFVGKWIGLYRGGGGGGLKPGGVKVGFYGIRKVPMNHVVTIATNPPMTN